MSCRKCDSKNLNLSPFCDLSNTNTETYWADQVESVYLAAGKSIGDPQQACLDFLHNFIINM